MPYLLGCICEAITVLSVSVCNICLGVFVKLLLFDRFLPAISAWVYL